MNTTDFSLHNVPVLLSANKSSEYQDQIRRITNVLMKFLKDNDLLVNVQPFGLDGSVRNDFVLRFSNVTEEGLEFFKKVVPGWSTYIDRGGSIENIIRLEKGLRRIREGRET